MFRFLESIKIEDGMLPYLRYHQMRVNHTFSYFKQSPALDLAQIADKICISTNSVSKLRVEYDLFGNVATEVLPYKRPEITTFQLVENDTIDYEFKFSNREIFKNIKSESTADEIIIIKKGHITDTSFSNLIFFKDGTWYTPDTFLLNGVMRRFLLTGGKIKEAKINLRNITEYSHFQIINAMNDLSTIPGYPIHDITNLPK